MYRLNIKTRIVVFVVFFELIAYSSIQLFNNYVYKQELVALKAQEIQQIFRVASEKINSVSLLMERNAIHLAEIGERLFQLKQNKTLSDSDLINEYKSTLVANFSGFPEAVGGGIWYEPFVYDTQRQYFGPYAYHVKDKVEFTWSLSNEIYDYHTMDWYTIASESQWGRDQNTYKPVIWTPPYADDAATYSLMMTVDAVMLDNNKQPIGISTVDWSLSNIKGFIESLEVTENSSSFLIHGQSKRVISSPQFNKQAISLPSLDWFSRLFQPMENEELKVLHKIELNGDMYNVYFTVTQSGFIFGSLSPLADLEKDIDEVTLLTLIVGSIIGSTFIIILLFFMKFLFSPFDQVLALIKASIGHAHDKNDIVTVQSIEYNKINEFTPITHALNEVYQQVNSYILDISHTNIRLKKTKLEIKALNEDLESKVKERTEQLKLKTEEAQASLAHLKATQQQLIEHEKHASLGRLVAGVSHEINTPLGICITAASCLEDETSLINDKLQNQALKKSDFDSAYQRITESSRILQINLQRTGKMIASFKQVAAVESHDEFREFELIDFIHNTLSPLISVFKEMNHRIEFTNNYDEVQLFSNPSTISLVLSNIIDNALNHGFQDIEHGVVTLEISESESNIQIIIEDNGIGMAPETVNLIFDPFFTTTRNIGNSGLGLHIVYNLVTQQLHGDIECTSNQQQGTRFIITLPLQLDIGN